MSFPSPFLQPEGPRKRHTLPPERDTHIKKRKDGGQRTRPPPSPAGKLPLNPQPSSPHSRPRQTTHQKPKLPPHRRPSAKSTTGRETIPPNAKSSVASSPKLDFTHFKRHKRGNLQYDGTVWRGVSVHRSWRLDFVQLVDGVGDIAELKVDSDGDFLLSGSCPRHWKSPGVEQQPRMRELGYNSKFCTKSRVGGR